MQRDPHSQIRHLRLTLRTIVAPYAAGCVGFEDRPLMNGTAFFPGGDGLWKPSPEDRPTFPYRGFLVLGSDFGDVASYDAQFEQPIEYRQELKGATWLGLIELLKLARISPSRCFFTKAWPCLREGNNPVKGGIPGARDPDFTNRCRSFFQLTLSEMRPSLVLLLGLAPTAFVANLKLASDVLKPWIRAKSWKQVDSMTCGRVGDTTFVPIVHPSMPNRRHRVFAITAEREQEFRAELLLAREAELVREALGADLAGQEA